MSFLEPLYHNNTGTIYAIKSSFGIDEPIGKIQMQIGDIDIVMQKNEVNAFHKILEQAKHGKSCQCPKCKKDVCYKIIKCETALATIKFKLKEENLKDLIELVESVSFHQEINLLLDNITN